MMTGEAGDESCERMDHFVHTRVRATAAEGYHPITISPIDWLGILYFAMNDYY